MSVMDLKGIAWAGNIYQKFEDMCLEVEEVMYQDTVKYLENQVQTVGSSVKKFYSEVMQDILPPDYAGPVKVAAADLLLNPYSLTDVIKKPKVTTKHDLENLKKKYEVYKGVGDINAEHKEAVAKQDYTVDHAKGDIGMRVFSNSYLGNRGSGLYRRHSGNSKGNYKIDMPYKMSKGTNPGSEILSKSTSFYPLSKESETCSSDVECDGKANRSVDNSAWTSIERVDSPASDVNLSSGIKEPSIVIPPETNRQVDSPSYYVNSSSDIKEPSLVVSPETSDTDLDSENLARMESNTDTICGSVPDEVMSSSEGISDNSEIDSDSNDIELEIIERLDESCVLVEGNELQVDPLKKRKPKSYKKKFQEAFPLRLKATRKHEYRKLAAQYSADSLKQEGMEQQADDVADSEWELL